MGSAKILAESSCSCLTCAARRSCSVPHMTGCQTDILEKIQFVKRRVARNANVFSAEDNLDKLYSVRFGQFKLLRKDSAGIDRVVQFYMPGDLVGLDAIASGKHNFRFVALENSEVCEISYNALKSMLAREVDLQTRFLEDMSRALNIQYRRADILSRPLLDERFALFLLDISERYAQLGYSSRIFRLAMARSDIGSYLGTTIESVSRIIARFNANGAATIMGRTVEIKNLEHLIGMYDAEPDRKPEAKTNIFGRAYSLESL